jgi:hypothetical protein
MNDDLDNRFRRADGEADWYLGDGLTKTAPAEERLSFAVLAALVAAVLLLFWWFR